MRRLSSAGVIAAVAFSIAGHGFAGESDKLLLADDFSAADASWGEHEGNFHCQDDAMAKLIAMTH